jgi:putative DNA primase/helicase
LRGFDTIRGIGESEHTPEAVIDIQREYLPEKSESCETEAGRSSYTLDEVSTASVSLGAVDIRQTLEEYAKTGNSKASEVLRQWDSPAGSSLTFPSASEADMSFVANLAFWCREDGSLMDECFRHSNRMRPKWDNPHYKDGRTYGEGTIETAIRTNWQTFSGNYVTEVSDR